MVDFAALRARSQDMTKLQQEIEKVKNKYQDDSNTSSDPRFWAPTQDPKTGTGWAVIRFLPFSLQDGEVDGVPDGKPWVKLTRHKFKGPTGSWYNNLSLETLGQADPCGDMNIEFLRSKDPVKVEFVKDDKNGSKRKNRYHSPILVVNDPANPAVNGHAKLFDFGEKIFGKIMDKMEPKYAGQTKVNVFDIVQGLNFIIKICKKAAGPNLKPQNNYDDSEWDVTLTPLASTEEECIRILQEAPGLKEFVAPEKFKTREVLQAELTKAMGTWAQSLPEASPAAYPAPLVIPTGTPVALAPSPTPLAATPVGTPVILSTTIGTAATPLAPAVKATPIVSSAPVAMTANDDAEALAMFASLAKGKA